VAGSGAIRSGLTVVLAIATAVLGALAGPWAAVAMCGALLLFVVGLVVVRADVGRSAPASAPATAPALADRAEGSWLSGLGGWIVAIVAFRLAMVVLLNGSSLWLYFAPDAIGWGAYGEQLAEFWMGNLAARPTFAESSGFLPFYYVLNAIVYLVTGATRWPLSFLNSMVGIGVAVLYGHIASRVYGRWAARFTFFAVACFPSMAVWTSMNIREVWSMAAIGLILNSALSVRERLTPTGLVTLALGVVWLATIRAYLVPLTLLAVLASMFTVRLRQLPYALVGLVVLLALTQLYRERLGFTPELLSVDSSLERVDTLRRGLAYGGSAYGEDADTTTVGGALAYLPLGIARFLCAPFPWTATSIRQLMTIPESLVWYYFLFAALREMVRGARRYLRKTALLTFFIMFVVAAYSLVSGNEGTAFRHRAQVLTVFFIFTAGDFARRRRVT